MKRLKKTSLALMAAAVAGILVGCASYKPYTYHDDRDEMPGPGLFSGEDGVFTIYGKKSADPSENAADPDEGYKDTEGKDLKTAP